MAGSREAQERFNAYVTRNYFGRRDVDELERNLHWLCGQLPESHGQPPRGCHGCGAYIGEEHHALCEWNKRAHAIRTHVASLSSEEEVREMLREMARRAYVYAPAKIDMDITVDAIIREHREERAMSLRDEIAEALGLGICWHEFTKMAERDEYFTRLADKIDDVPLRIEAALRATAEWPDIRGLEPEELQRHRDAAIAAGIAALRGELGED